MGLRATELEIVKSFRALDQISELMATLREISLDKLDVDHPHSEERCRVDIEPIDPGPEVKSGTRNSDRLSDLDHVPSSDKNRLDVRVARFQTPAVVDGQVQLPRHRSGKHDCASTGRNNRLAG